MHVNLGTTIFNGKIKTNFLKKILNFNFFLKKWFINKFLLISLVLSK